VLAPPPSWEWQASDARVNPSAGVTHDWWNVDPDWFKESHPPPPPPSPPPLQLEEDVREQNAVNVAIQKLQHKLTNTKVIPTSTSSSTTTDAPANN